MQNEHPISLSWYTDGPQFIKEQEQLFAGFPIYLGHASAVQERGDYYVLPTTRDGEMMVHTGKDVLVLSNICRHRQAIMLEGKGNRKSITCPVHFWRFGLEGQVESGRGVPLHICESLPKTPYINYNGFLFRDQGNTAQLIKGLDALPALQKNQYGFGSYEVLQSNYNWKIFMETYIDLYHVPTIHPGLGRFANLEEVSWDLGTNYSTQRVGILPANSNPSLHYQKFGQLLQQIAGYESQCHITWFSLYPNIMIELYPYNAVVSIAVPTATNKTQNVVEFLYSKELDQYPFGQELHQAFKDSYLETAGEDDWACEKIQQGRERLRALNREEHGPFHPSFETGFASFYDYWHQHMAL